jgi:AAA+ superfamily predicted ATPase
VIDTPAPETSFDMAVRIIREMIEFKIPDSKEKESLLSHMKHVKLPPMADSDAQILSIQMIKLQGKMARMQAALRRCEPWNDEWKASL